MDRRGLSDPILTDFFHIPISRVAKRSCVTCGGTGSERTGKGLALGPPNPCQPPGNRRRNALFPSESARLKSSTEKNGSALCLKTNRAAHRSEIFRAWKAGCRLIDRPAIRLSGFIRAVADRKFGVRRINHLNSECIESGM